MALVILAAIQDSATVVDWLQGDVVDILEDGVHPGTSIVDGDWLTGTVIHPNFWLIHVADATRSECRTLLYQMTQVDENGELVNVTQRARKMTYNRLPKPVQRDLDRTQRYSVSFATLQSLVQTR